jgi:hypothetical protein
MIVQTNERSKIKITIRNCTIQEEEIMEEIVL